jgi:hypothetical protein
MTHTEPAAEEGLARGVAVRVGDVDDAALLGEDCPKPHAVPAARPTRQAAIGANRIIRLTSALE